MSGPRQRHTSCAVMILVATMAPVAARGQSPGPTQQPLLDRFFLPDPFHLPGDILDEKLAEWRLRRDRARVQDDLDRGDAAAVNRDLNRVQRDTRWIWYDRRRIQGDSLHRRDPWLPAPAPLPMGATLVPHPQYPGYGYLPTDPTQLYRLPAPAADAPGDPASGRVPVEIRNSGPPGTAVTYEVDGVAYRTEGGGVRKLVVDPKSTIRYDRGLGLGDQRYALSAGAYEFRSGTGGLALFKLPPPP